MIQIQSTADVRTNGIKCLIYGAWGVGKTPLLATAPYPIILSAENGLLSLQGTHTPYIQIDDLASLYEAYNWWVSSREAQQFYTLGLDSLSEIAETCLSAEKKKTKDPRKAFGEVIDKVIDLAKAFRDVPKRTVVLIAKEEYSKDEATGAMLYQPMMPGTKLGQKLPYYFDEVFRMIVHPQSRTHRVLCTARSYQHEARDRSGRLDEFEQPNLTAVFSKILAVK